MPVAMPVARPVARRWPIRRRSVLADGLGDEGDQPEHRRRRPLGVEAPPVDQALVRRQVPEDVQRPGRAGLLLARPRRRLGLDGPQEGGAPTVVDGTEGRVVGFVDRRAGGEVLERPQDLRRHLADRREVDRLVVDPGLVVQPLHHGVAQVPLGGEVPVHGALADPRPLGDRPDGQLAPAPRGRLVRQRGSGGDDPLAGLGGAPAADRAVVPASRLRAVGGSRGVPHAATLPMAAVALPQLSRQTPVANRCSATGGTLMEHPAALMDAACAQTGLDDFGDDSFRDGLDRLVHSLRDRGDAQRDGEGRARLPRHEPPRATAAGRGLVPAAPRDRRRAHRGAADRPRAATHRLDRAVVPARRGPRRPVAAPVGGDQPVPAPVDGRGPRPAHRPGDRRRRRCRTRWRPGWRRWCPRRRPGPRSART